MLADTNVTMQTPASRFGLKECGISVFMLTRMCSETVFIYSLVQTFPYSLLAFFSPLHREPYAEDCDCEGDETERARKFWRTHPAIAETHDLTP